VAQSSIVDNTTFTALHTKLLYEHSRQLTAHHIIMSSAPLTSLTYPVSTHNKALCIPLPCFCHGPYTAVHLLENILYTYTTCLNIRRLQ